MQVVVNLILDMHKMGHPSFQQLDIEQVLHRAQELPENGVPPEVLKVIQNVEDTAHENLQPQKAATPCEGMQDPVNAGRSFASQRARAIVDEGHALQDAGQVGTAALKQVQDELTATEDAPRQGPLTLEVRTGNLFVDQFHPDYFAMAFPFCFKYGIACPEVHNTVKKTEAQEALEDQQPCAPTAPYRRLSANPNAPKVGAEDWALTMARRCETQFQRDWVFLFTLWNYIFRTKVNLQQNAYVYAVPDNNNPGRTRMLSSEEISEGAEELLKTLATGKYLDITGEFKAVKGDMTKLRHVPGMGEAARKVLSNVEARTRAIPGTHEIRKTMRHQTHAYQVAYGTAIFVTFSPSEKDSTLMVRLARARQTDPAVQVDGSAFWHRRDKPNLDVDFMRLSPEALAQDQWAGHEYF